VNTLLEDRQGRLWFGTDNGVSCLVGTDFTTYRTADGLVHNFVVTSVEDHRGWLWFGTWDGGVSCYDGNRFTNYTTADGLVHNHVTCILEDRQGWLWFTTWGGGVSCYRDGVFTDYTAADGLGHNMLRSVMEDRHGHLWFSTFGGGVSRYDGQVFQRLTRREGLAHDTVQQVLQEREGDSYWIATEGGVTRYRPYQGLPRVQLKEVIADQRYEAAAALRVPESQRFILFQFQGVSWTTGPEGLAYTYRLVGYDADWRTTYDRQVEYSDLALGQYAFQVKAIDCDHNYSEPAQVQLTVEPDLRLEALTEALSLSGGMEEFVGESVALRQVQAQLVEVAGTQLTVLLLGETGTGKGLAARTLHRLGDRGSGRLSN
jgi:hypothetical protein